ncbi:MAG: MFS transporter [Pseudomonadota bacterium]|nr:MFS transporter [Pseudomonadota bacterium]
MNQETLTGSSLAQRTYRKVSLRILPLIALGYGAAYIDRVNISFAALQMNRDLKFSGTIYGLGAGIFFLSYSALEIPSNLLLYRFGARRWLARIMVSWGLIAMGMVFVRTPMQFYVARFLLGAAEAGFFPGVIFYLMQWFPADLRARSVTRFYIAWPLSSVIMGVVAGSLMGLDGRLGMAGWQWLFVVEGLPAVVLGVVFFLLLPDGPADASWLTQPERDAIIADVRRPKLLAPEPCEALGPGLRDPRVWMLATFMFFMLASSYAYSFSAPSLVLKLSGLSIGGTGFVIAGMNLLGAGAMLVNGWLSDRAKDPYRHVIPGCLMMSGGFLALGVSSDPAIALSGLLCLIMGHMSMQGPLWAISTAFLRGRAAAAGIAAMNSVGILGGFAGPYWVGFAKDLTGNEQRGMVPMVTPMLMGAGTMLYLRYRAKRPKALRVAMST